MRNGRWLVWGMPCALALFGVSLVGCSGGGSGAEPGNNGGSGGGGSGSGGSSSNGDSQCQELTVVSPRSLGTDVDLFRHIQGDTVTGDLFISDLNELYGLAPGASEPALLTDKLISDGVFWISGSQLLNPGQFSGLPSDPAIPVLYSVPRTGGQQTLLVSVPKAASDSDRREVRSVQIQGDNVFWIQIDGTKAHFNTFVATVYKTSWSNPQTPVALYSSTHDLKELLVAGKRLLVEQQVGDDPNSGTFEQQILSLDAPTTGTPQTAQALFGGDIGLGDDTAMLVSKSDLDNHPDMIGTYRVLNDGSGAEQITRNIFTKADVRDGTWGISAYNSTANQYEIFAYQPGTGKRKIGCLPYKTTSVHAVGVGKGAIYVSILRDEKASILKFPL